MSGVQVEMLEARQLLSASASAGLHAQVDKPAHLLLGPLSAGTDPSALYVTAPGTPAAVYAIKEVDRGKKVFARATVTFTFPGANTVNLNASGQLEPVLTTQVMVGPTGPFSNSTIRVRRMPIDPVVVNQQTTAPAELVGVPSSITSGTERIDWGDGTAPDIIAGSVSRGIFDAQVFHVYTTVRTYTAKITFTSGTRTLASTREVIHVQQNSSDGATLKLTTGTPYTGVLGAIFMVKTPQKVAVYWGDGTHSYGTAKSIGNDQYQISGTHTYASPANYQIKLVASVDPGPLIFYPGMHEPDTVVYPGDTGQTFSTAIVSGPSVTLPAPSAQISVPTTTIDEPGGILNDLGVTVTPDGSAAFNNTVYAIVNWGDGVVPDGSADTTLDPGSGKFVVYRNYAGLDGATPVDKTLNNSMQVFLNDHDDPSKNTLLGTAQVTVHLHNP